MPLLADDGVGLAWTLGLVAGLAVVGEGVLASRLRGPRLPSLAIGYLGSWLDWSELAEADLDPGDLDRSDRSRLGGWKQPGSGLEG